MSFESIRIILVGCWLSMYAIWTLSDPRPFKERVEEYFRLRPLLYALTLFIGLFISVYWSDMFLWNSEKNIVWSYLGLLIFLIGFGIAIWAKVTMKQVWGIPGQHNFKRQNKLIRSGPFKYTRNPIYLGLILMFFGYFIGIQSYLIVLAFAGTFYFYKMALIEEKYLEKYFGKEYLKYKKEVRLLI